MKNTNHGQKIDSDQNQKSQNDFNRDLKIMI